MITILEGPAWEPPEGLPTPGQELWHMEEIGPHTGRWSQISGKIASPPFRTKYKQGYSEQWDLHRLVSADSEGIARIIPSRFWTGRNFTDAELRCGFNEYGA